MGNNTKMNVSKKKYDLENCFLTKNCMPDWRPAIESSKIIYEVKKGQAIFLEDDKVEGIYFIYTGLVKVHKHWDEGKELIVRFARDGQILGHRGLSSKNKFYPISATALSDCVVCYITMDFFNSTLKVNPEFHHKFLMFFADELQESEKRMKNLAHMTVKGRFALALEYFMEVFGYNEEDQSINITFSKQEIASYIGTTYETLFRTINDLTEEKIIETSHRRYIVLDKEKLKSCSQVG